MTAILLAVPAPVRAFDPTTPGIWGAIFDAFWAAEGEARQRDMALACLTSPVKLAPQDDGYAITTFVLDPSALENGELVYFRDYETTCRWEPEAGIEQCYDEADEIFFHTAYREAEGLPGVLRAWFLASRDLESFLVGGLLPPQDVSYLIFPCPPTAQPPAATLEAAEASPDAAIDALGRYDANWFECGSPFCSELDERLLELAE